MEESFNLSKEKEFENYEFIEDMLKSIPEADLNDSTKEKIKYYLSYCKNEDKIKIKKAIEEKDYIFLKKCFSNELEFGTGGIRTIMEIGSSFLNEVTIAKAATATVNFFNKYFDDNFKDISNKKVFDKGGVNSNIEKSVCISYDTRHKSDIFAKISAIIAAKNGFKVYFAENPLPTPFLSYMVRKTNSCFGVIITASHNPKNYNGFKVYDETGCQILSEKADKIIEIYESNVQIENIEINDFEKLLENNKIELIGESYIVKFIDDITSLRIDRKLENNIRLLNVVYSSLQGTGINIFRKLEQKLRFNTFYVESQINVDPDFSNVRSLNPENRESFEQALDIARKNKADLVILTDPDADRVGFAFYDDDGYFLPTGNEVAVMIFYYICNQKRLNEIETSLKNNDNIDNGKEYYAVTTIVTTDLLEIIGRYFGIEVIKTLTGFKYIGDQINKNKDKKFLFAAEESYGFLTVDCLRDKDAFSMINVVLEFLSYLKSQKTNARRYLKSIYEQFGYYQNELVNIDFSENENKDKIKKIMDYLRENPIESINKFKVRKIFDFNDNIENFPKSNLLQYIGENFKITVRPSGTEPKIKIYFQVVAHNEYKSKELLETFKNFFISLIKTEY